MPRRIDAARDLDMGGHFEPLGRAFYMPSATRVAPALLGHFLLRRTEGGVAGGLIVEVEAYLTDDPASHGFRRETSRNRAMYGPPGHAYVYFIYGAHFCFNAVCGPAGVAEAVLVRAVEPLFDINWIRRQRRVENVRQLTSGPGKLCAALGIGRHHDGVDLCEPGSPVFIAANPALERCRLELGPVLTGRRVGLSKAADLPLRYLLAGSRYVSRRLTS